MRDIRSVAVGYVGMLFPDCPDCCTSRTRGDLCEPCKAAHAIILAAMQEGQAISREVGMRAARELMGGVMFGAALAMVLGGVLWLIEKL